MYITLSRMSPMQVAKIQQNISDQYLELGHNNPEIQAISFLLHGLLK